MQKRRILITKNRNNMKKVFIGKLIALLFLCLLQTHVFAQGRQISGTVTDENGQPLPGVSIMVKGTTEGTITDLIAPKKK